MGFLNWTLSLFKRLFLFPINLIKRVVVGIIVYLLIRIAVIAVIIFIGVYFILDVPISDIVGFF